MSFVFLSHWRILSLNSFCVWLHYQEESCMKEVKLTVEMLQSALYCSDECKVSLREHLLILPLIVP